MTRKKHTRNEPLDMPLHVGDIVKFKDPKWQAKFTMTYGPTHPPSWWANEFVVIEILGADEATYQWTYIVLEAYFDDQNTSEITCTAEKVEKIGEIEDATIIE